MPESAKRRRLRAAVVSGVILTALGSPLAAHAADLDTPTDTQITNINNGNVYNFQGIGAITLTDLLSLLGLQP